MRLEDPRFSTPGKVGRFGPAVAFLPVLAFLLTRFLAPTPAFGQADIPEIHRQPLADLDAREGTVQPTSAQKAIVAGLGADVRWNRFGTPQSLIKYGGYLGTGPGGDAVNAAKGWIRSNKALFRLSDEGVNNLDLLNDSKMIGTTGHAVIFRQRFGNLGAAEDGMITVGIKDGKVAYVSSSIAGDGSVPAAATLTPQAAWRAAAAEVGRSVPLTSISKVRPENSWAVFDVAGFSHPQRARLGALPMSRDAVRPVYEVNVLDVNGGLSIAYTSFVDARTGEVLRRVNRNQRLAALAPTATQFMGAYPEPDNDPSTVECGPQHFFTVPGGTLTIDVVASAAIITNDIVLHLFRPDDVEAAAFDSGFSPEAIHYDVQGADAPFVGGANNMWYVLVCAFEPPTIDHQSPFTYEGVATTNDVAAAEVPIEARWKFFANSPLLSGQDTDIRLVGCWIFPGVGCTYDLDVGPAGQNLAARAPWDFEFTANTSTFTTDGNAATTQETWTSPLSPGAYLHQPTSTTRDYADPALVPFDDEWQNSKCLPTFVPVPGRSPLDTYPDLNASIVNLFSGHNRVHDWSYYLGFTEENSNLQKRNFLNTTPDRENDPEIGDVQAAAQTGGAPGFLGRDNANQITLQDGIPGITNQYLFQPIAGAFYAPCTDGDFDGTVFVHEYTHAISNRMVAGPNSGLSGYQAGSMGESWSDLVAIEYLREYNFAVNDGENPLAVGPYVTGNKQLGIRNYAMSPNPLNYSDLGYGTPGPEVHDDGEVWNAANWEVRQLLVNKYNGSFPASNNALQKQCADGIRPADLCPGNRRWIQIVFDAFLLMP